MLDTKQLKSLGLRFARIFQMAVRTAIMFNPEHPNAQRPMQQSFDVLNSLIKEAGKFTIGFVDSQIVLNNLLTTDPSLEQLNKEFLKRGIAAVTFEPGLTVARYKKVVAVIAAPTKTIDEAGGFRAYLEENEIEGTRILLAAKNQKKNEQGDTILETSSEAYILSKQMEQDAGSRDFMDSVDALLESACLDPSARNAILSGVSGFADQGYGVPIPMPNLVVAKDGETGGGGSGNGAANGGAGAGPGGGVEGASGQSAAAASAVAGVAGAIPGGPTGFAPGNGIGTGPGSGGLPGGIGMGGGFPGGVGTGVGYGSGYGDGTGVGPGGTGSGGTGTFATRLGQGSVPGHYTFMELVENSVQRSLLEDEGNPAKSYNSLARILQSMGVDKILASFPTEKQEQLASAPAEQVAAEYVEDTALHWAGKQLTSPGGEKVEVEEEVLRVLARTLRATQTADRLSQKLVKFIQDFAIPPHMQQQIQSELRWTTLDPKTKYSQLLEMKQYNQVQFRRLREFVKESVSSRQMERVNALVDHYFEFLDDEKHEIQLEDLSRAPELIRSVPVGRIDFADKAIDRLGRALTRETLSEFIHFQVATTLTVLAQAIATYEDFDHVLQIGGLLERSEKRDPVKHVRCCRVGITRLVPVGAHERLVELFLLNRGDSAWAKKAVTLLGYGTPASVDNVLTHLVIEQDAKNRLALVRLASQLGSAAIVASRKFMADERWYVVRNMCSVLSDLKDPELATSIGPALQHSDARVQRAALTALIRNRAQGRAKVIAEALPKLPPDLLEEALDELMFLKDPGTATALGSFIKQGKASVAMLRKAMQILTVLPVDALDQYASILLAGTLDPEIRRTALKLLSAAKTETSMETVQKLADSADRLAAEARASLPSKK